jgi:hypothetical protein
MMIENDLVAMERDQLFALKTVRMITPNFYRTIIVGSAMARVPVKLTNCVITFLVE